MRAFAADDRGEQAALPAYRFAVERPLRDSRQAEHRRRQSNGLRELQEDGVNRLIAEALAANDTVVASSGKPERAPAARCGDTAQMACE